MESSKELIQFIACAFVVEQLKGLESSLGDFRSNATLQAVLEVMLSNGT